MDTNDWVVFGVFVGIWFATVIEALVVSIMRRKNNFAFWTLIIGGLVRCVTMATMDTYGEIFSDFAGLLFFSSCCIVLTQIVRNFHEKRNNRNGVYYSMVFVLIGYNVLFYILEICVAGFTIYATNTSSNKSTTNSATDNNDINADDSVSPIDYDVLIRFILCLLFGLSYLFLSVMYVVIFFMLRNSWVYLKKIAIFCKCS